jgi:ureidoglycolate hydrolase
MKTMKLGGVDTAAHDAPGYKPLLVSDGDWMAAIMNGTRTSWTVPTLIEHHPKTDELFVLVAGRAMLIAAGRGKHPGRVRCVEMKRNVLYNVKAGTWHATPMTPRARFIIIERTGTDKTGSFSEPLSAAQRSAIRLGDRR